MITTRDVVGVEVNGSARTVRFADGGTVDAHTVILATGVSYRQLAAPGLDELAGRGVFYGSALSEAPGCAGQDVYIVGGANSAGQAAVYFSRYARSVTMLVRGPSLEAVDVLLPDPADSRASETSRSAPTPRSSAATATSTSRDLTLRNNVSGEEDKVETGLLFCFIGAAPRTEWLDGAAVRDKRGFVVAGPDLVVDGKRPRGLAAGPRPLSPGDQHPRRVRRRRRAGRLGQTGGLRRRRGRDGRHPGAQVFGEAMSEACERIDVTR